MTTNAELIERIDHETIEPMERYAGGHDSQMKGLLKDVTVLSHWNEGEYQGKVATVVRLNDTGEVVMYSDYYGSCSGCDAWEDADDDDVRRMCIQMAAGAKIFPNEEQAIAFLKLRRAEGEDFDFDDDVRIGLLDRWHNKPTREQ